MPLLDEVAAKLVSAGVGAINTNIFLGSSADIPTGSGTDGPYLLLKETGGTDPSSTQNDTGTERFSLHLSTRAKKYQVARAMCKAAWLALGGVNGLHNVTLSGTAYIRLKVKGSPADIGSDAEKRPMTSFNVEGEKYPS